MNTINVFFSNMINTVARRRVFIDLQRIYFNIKDEMNAKPDKYPDEWNTLITRKEFMGFL